MSGNGFFDSKLLDPLRVKPSEPAKPTNADRVRAALRESLFDGITGASAEGGDLVLRNVPTVAELDAADARETARAAAVAERAAARAIIAEKSREVDALEVQIEKRESQAKIARVDEYCRAKGWDPHGPKRTKAVSQMAKRGLL